MSASAQRGQRLYQANCVVCHRADSAEPLNGPGMKGIFHKPYLPSGAPANEERVREAVRMGRRAMPPFGPAFDDRQLKDLIAYFRTL